MSKIGKINISIPEKVKVVLNGNLLNIEGPLGKATLNIDVDMFDAGHFRGNLFINIETIIGNEFRGVDPNQNNYTADLSVFIRLPKGELSTTFHHVSRHLADRATDKSVSWNMFGVGYGNTFTLGDMNLDAGVRALWTVERAGVDYDAQYGGYLKVMRPFNDPTILIYTCSHFANHGSPIGFPSVFSFPGPL